MQMHAQQQKSLLVTNTNYVGAHDSKLHALHLRGEIIARYRECQLRQQQANLDYFYEALQNGFGSSDHHRSRSQVCPSPMSLFNYSLQASSVWHVCAPARTCHWAFHHSCSVFSLMGWICQTRARSATTLSSTSRCSACAGQTWIWRATWMASLPTSELSAAVMLTCSFGILVPHRN